MNDFTSPPSGGDNFSCANDSPEILRVIAVGSLKAVNHHIMHMYQLGYAEPGDWSRPLPTVNPNEVMRILTKRIMRLGN
ncbi:MAG: hypothetical protein ACFE0I_16900 [Elainellaceae cyanobacterium]